MPPLFSRMAVRRMMECGALSGLVLRRTDMLPQATFERAEMLLTRTSDALLCLEAYEKQGYRLILPESREWPKALRVLGGRGTALPLYEGKRVAAGAANRCGGGQQGDCACDKRHGGAAWRHAGRRRDNDGLRRRARRGSRGAGCAAGCRRFVDSRSGGLCGAGLRAEREAAALQTGRLLLLCETLPDAPFSAARALARNHTIYALGKNAIVVAARNGVGGSWRGATAGLCGNFSSVYVPDGDVVDFEGNRALFEYGARKIDLSGKRTIGEQLCAGSRYLFCEIAKEA